MQYPPYNAVCQVSVKTIKLTCLTAPGTGKNHSWKISIAGQMPDDIVFHASTSYGPPIIYEILQNDGQPFLSGKTTGGDKLLIVGNNFGVANHPTKHPSVAYGAELVYGTLYDNNDALVSNRNFIASTCSVTKAHTEITCFTMEGAGFAYLLQLMLDGQPSVVATTTYARPIISSIVGPGSQEAVEDGNQLVDIHGSNFGPNLTSSDSFLESVTYGEDGSEYVADCILISHTLIRCKTVPGFGINLIWRVTILGQTSLITTDGRTSYAAPVILGANPISVQTFGSEVVQLEGSNFGLADSSSNPVFTNVKIKYQNVFYEADIDRTKSENGIYFSRVLEYGMHTIAFRSPVLECIVCNPMFSVKVKVKTYAGVELYSSWFDINSGSIINQIYVTDGSTVSRHVHIAVKILPTGYRCNSF